MAKWVKGQSGNPKGRPRKGLALSDALEKRGSEVIDVDGVEATRLEHIMRVLHERAQDGDTRAIEIIFDRMAGKPRQSIDLSTEDDRKPVRISVVERPNGNGGGRDDPSELQPGDD